MQLILITKLLSKITSNLMNYIYNAYSLNCRYWNEYNEYKRQLLEYEDAQRRSVNCIHIMDGMLWMACYACCNLIRSTLVSQPE